MTPSARLRSIDFLRGVAALAVAFGHAIVAAPYTEIAGKWFEQLCVHIMWIAVSGVALFFVISGFCIHLGQARHEGVGTFRFGAFWRRRIWRLYPTYFVALCASMALLLLHWRMGTGEALLGRYPQPPGSWLAADFGLHAFMLHGLHPFFDQAAGNPPLWTLARTPIVDGLTALVPGLSGQARVSNNHELNRLRLGPCAFDPNYFAIVSNFESEDPRWRFWRNFRKDRVVDLATDALFPKENDLVVDTDSMTDFGVPKLKLAGAACDFGTSASVWHCSYFRDKKAIKYIADTFKN